MSTRTTYPASRTPAGMILELRRSLGDVRDMVQAFASQAAEYEDERLYARQVTEAFGALNLAERELRELEDVLEEKVAGDEAWSAALQVIYLSAERARRKPR
jgi:hypothetical protein